MVAKGVAWPRFFCIVLFVTIAGPKDPGQFVLPQPDVSAFMHFPHHYSLLVRRRREELVVCLEGRLVHINI